MRKILVLGGNIAQVPLIEAAKKEGYYVVLVDYTTTNPGIALADSHHQVNFMDREKVLEIARKENIHGVISNSEAAMPIVAYVSETLGLVGNTLDSVRKINSKIDFRILQKELGAYAPEHFVTGSFEEAQEKLEWLTFPVVLKPSKSSGSRGTTVVPDRESFRNYRKEWEACSQFSLDNQVVLEEYAQMQIPGHTIEAEVFLCNGKFLWDGLFTNIRKLDALSIPMNNIFPPLITEEQERETKELIQKLLLEAGIVFGEYNIELFYTTTGALFCIEINARQGGCGMPDLVRRYCGVDMYKLLVTTAMGDIAYFEEILQKDREYKFVVRYEVFSQKDGVFRELFIAQDLQPFVTDVQIFSKPGEAVRACVAAGDIVAWVDLEFDTREQQLCSLKRIEEEIYPVLES